MIESSLTRWKRVALSQAYYDATCDIFDKIPHQLVSFINQGNVSAIAKYLSKNKDSLHQLIG